MTLTWRRSSPRPRASAGFSLLEVILALAILGGAVAVLGEALRTGIRAAHSARDLTHAQLLSESLMDEIVAGLVPLEPTQNVPFEFEVGNNAIPWMFSIATETAEDEGLYVVTVTVAQDLPPEKNPVTYSLARWVPDPAIEPGTVLPGSSGTASDGSASGGTTSSGGAATPGGSPSSGTSSEDLWAGFE